MFNVAADSGYSGCFSTAEKTLYKGNVDFNTGLTFVHVSFDLQLVLVNSYIDQSAGPKGGDRRSKLTMAKPSDLDIRVDVHQSRCH